MAKKTLSVTRKKAAETPEKTLSNIALKDLTGVPKNVDLQRTNIVLTVEDYKKLKMHATMKGKTFQDFLYINTRQWLDKLPDL